MKGDKTKCLVLWSGSQVLRFADIDKGGISSHSTRRRCAELGPGAMNGTHLRSLHSVLHSPFESLKSSVGAQSSCR